MIRQRHTATLLTPIAIAVLSVINLPLVIADQSPSRKLDREWPVEWRMQLLDKAEQPDRVPMVAAPGVVAINDWQTAIDTTWGPGLPDSTKWNIYWTYWDRVDRHFACFPDLTLDWDSARVADSIEIAGGVSRGRFSAIIQRLASSLLEAHTDAYDIDVQSTTGAPGVPVLYRGDWGSSARFGAGLTPLPDSTLLVYQVGTGHPFGLEPGDQILGYDGALWKDQYPQLMAANLPMKWNSGGSNAASRHHKMSMAAGRNWHLFDTIDVVKYATGDTVHFPTSLMLTSTAYTYNTEQLDIPGVPKPDLFSSIPCSWGIIDGTSMGYIYVQAWGGKADTLFYNAVDSLMHHHQTTGMIIDFRLNYGGNMYLSYDALSLLFKDTALTVDFVGRCNGADHLALCEHASPPENYQVEGDPGTYYDKPIAVLVGPGAISSGDFVALFLSHHPMAKFFGKPTDGAFNHPHPTDIHADFWFRYALFDSYQPSAPGVYLTRKGFPSTIDYPSVPFEEVWLTPDNVAQGKDDVVEAAVAWINSYDRDADSIPDVVDNCRDIANTAQDNFDGDAHGDVCDICPRYDVPGDLPVFTGDVNRLFEDVVINSSDIIYLVNFVFKSGPEPIPHFAAGDCTHDTNVNASDIIWLVNYVFKSGPEPLDACALLPSD